MIFASAIAGFFFFARGVASDRYQTGTIQFASQGSTCQRLAIDNSTGMIKPGQQMPCADGPKEAAKSSAETPSRYSKSSAEPSSRYSSGGRVDAIRDSFNN